MPLGVLSGRSTAAGGVSTEDAAYDGDGEGWKRMASQPHVTAVRVGRSGGEAKARKNPHHEERPKLDTYSRQHGVDSDAYDRARRLAEFAALTSAKGLWMGAVLTSAPAFALGVAEAKAPLAALLQGREGEAGVLLDATEWARLQPFAAAFVELGPLAERAAAPRVSPGLLGAMRPEPEALCITAPVQERVEALVEVLGGAEIDAEAAAEMLSLDPARYMLLYWHGVSRRRQDHGDTSGGSITPEGEAAIVAPVDALAACVATVTFDLYRGKASRTCFSDGGVPARRRCPLLHLRGGARAAFPAPAT